MGFLWGVGPRGAIICSWKPGAPGGCTATSGGLRLEHLEDLIRARGLLGPSLSKQGDPARVPPTQPENFPPKKAFLKTGFQTGLPQRGHYQQDALKHHPQRETCENPGEKMGRCAYMPRGWLGLPKSARVSFGVPCELRASEVALVEIICHAFALMVRVQKRLGLRPRSSISSRKGSGERNCRGHCRATQACSCLHCNM